MGKVALTRARSVRAVIAFVGFLVLSGFPTSLHAGVLLEDHFDGSGPGTIHGGEMIRKGSLTGWISNTATEPGDPGFAGSHVVTYDMGNTLGAIPPSGSVVLDVVYWRAGGKEYKYKNDAFSTLIDFVNADATTALLLYAAWEGYSVKGESQLVFWAPGQTGWKDAYGMWIPLGRKYKIGDRVRIAFTWGPQPDRDNKVYIDGVALPSYKNIKGTRIMASRAQDVPSLLKNVNRIRVGVGSGPGEHYPDGDCPMYNTLIDRLAIHDTILTSADLSSVPMISAVTDDTFKVPGISGKLVAGDKVNVELKASPGGTASFDMGNVKGIALAEAPPTEGGPGIPAVDNGTYRGGYTIKAGDDFENGRIIGHFTSQDNVAAGPVASASKWTIDTKPVVTFNIDKKDLPADSTAIARIKLAAKDVNGNPVKGRHLKLTLAATNEYTGSVGAGDFGKDIGATVETRWKGETDSWGEVEFDYTAGFAAKTVILTAKDLDSGGVTIDYITAFKEASIDIALTPPVSRAAARRGLTYVLKVEASRTELTADGRSRSVIRATLLDPNGTSVAGDPVAFTLSSPNGTLRTISGTTDSSGAATAEYTAGKKIGIVVVTATATLRNATGNVSVILLSDAPAKVYLKARPESLPADGISRADIQVKVTDVNDNPNKDTKVEFRVAKGGGKLEVADRVTDRFGDAQNRYTAGTAAGIASVVATVRSKIPTETELSNARNVLFAPYNPEGDEIRVEKWLKKKGDAFTRGEPLMEYTAGRRGDVRRILAPYDGKLGEILVEYWDTAEVGQTLATLIPASVGR